MLQRVPSDGPGRIVISLTDCFAIGGVQTWAVELCHRLRSRGQDSLLLTSGPLPDLLSVPSGIEQVTYGPNDWGAISTANVATCQRLLPAVIIPNLSRDVYATCALLARKHPESLRVIGVCHADCEFYYSLLAFYERSIHCFLAVSNECGAKLRLLLPHRAQDIVVRPYAVPVADTLHRDYGRESDPLRLLYAGRIEEEQKRVSDLIQLAKHLAGRGVSFHLRIVGEGSAKPGLCRALENLDSAVRRSVTIEAGVPRQEMPALLASTDVCVMVSAYEGTSVFLLEAMAQGCVPVVTRVSGTAALIEDGVNGQQSPVGDVATMADIMARLAGDRKQLQSMGKAAHARAMTYSYAQYVPWFEELLDRVWRQPARRWPRTQPVFPWRQSLMGGIASAIPGGRRAWRFLTRQ